MPQAAHTALGHSRSKTSANQPSENRARPSLGSTAHLTPQDQAALHRRYDTSRIPIHHYTNTVGIAPDPRRPFWRQTQTPAAIAAPHKSWDRSPTSHSTPLNAAHRLAITTPRNTSSPSVHDIGRSG